jgi:hypothetical protein
MFTNRLNKLSQLVLGKYERRLSWREARQFQRRYWQVNPHMMHVVCVPAFAHKARNSLRHHYGRSP